MATMLHRRIPVMGSTARERSRDFVEGGTLRMLPLFVRYTALRLASRVLGEAGYRRLRAAGLGS